MIPGETEKTVFLRERVATDVRNAYYKVQEQNMKVLLRETK